MIKYYRLSEKIILPKEFAVLKGVYSLHALDGGDQPLHLNRLLGIDEDGILYIGQTSKQDFKKRVEMLRRVLNPSKKSTGHSGARNYKQIQKLREKFPIEVLAVRIEATDTPKAMEREQIENYRQKFGEVPPLNGSK